MAEPFAYLSATLRLHEKSLVVKVSPPLKLQYGVAAWDGHASRDAIESTYQTWLRLAPAAQPACPTPQAEQPPTR